MPLQRNYRFVFQNQLLNTIQANQLTLSARRWKFNTSGAIEFESSETLLHNQIAPLANNAFVATTGIDNSASGFLGGAFEIYCTPTGAGTSGILLCFYETSTDGGTTFDSDSDLSVGDNGRLVAIATIDTVGTGVKSFRIS